MVRHNNEIRIALINPVGIKSGRIFFLRIEIYTHEHLAKILFDMKGCGMMRKEHDFLGEMDVPDEVYYGVQTVRAMENFHITGEEVDKEFIQAVVMVKKAAALANMDTGRMKPEIGNALVAAADEILSGALLDQFPVDPIQGGAGTSVNMNVNEVLTNRALELTGHKKGEYQFISPNNHANMAQSTNDVFPTAIKVCMRYKAKKLIEALKRLAVELDKKAVEFKDVVKMGRTHLQDAIPITVGQEMASYASAVRRGIRRIQRASASNLLVMNMGGTAIGTGLNAEPEYIERVRIRLSEVTGEEYHTAENLTDATNNTDLFADMAAATKVTALVLIKMANDFRLMASGPCCGLGELKLPMRQPGSSIMPGKVNPVIAEVLDQACYQVIACDLAVTFGVENGQFELNVMEPVISYNMFLSMRCLTNAINTFVDNLLVNLEVDEKRCRELVEHSVGIITALMPHIGYENCSALAKEAYETGRPVRDLVLEHEYLTADQLDHILLPREMTTPGIAGAAYHEYRNSLAHLKKD